jgi:hypothetical protein
MENGMKFNILRPEAGFSGRARNLKRWRFNGEAKTNSADGALSFRAALH